MTDLDVAVAKACFLNAERSLIQRHRRGQVAELRTRVSKVAQCDRQIDVVWAASLRLYRKGLFEERHRSPAARAWTRVQTQRGKDEGLSRTHWNARVCRWAVARLTRRMATS